jgi:hypothetical protein
MRWSILLLIVIVSKICNAQQLQHLWSNVQISDNKSNGFFDYFINSNSKYVYAKCSNYAYNKRSADKKIKLSSYEKGTMNKVTTVELRGFSKKKSSQQYKELTYFRTLVFDDCILVFWRKETKSKEELYVETFSEELQQTSDLTKIFEAETFKNATSKDRRSIFLMREGEKGNNLLIGYELPTEALTKLKVHYKWLTLKLEVLAENTIELPVTLKSKNQGINGWYNYAEDGNLYIASRLEYSEKEKATTLKGGNTNYFVISKVNLLSGEIGSAAIKPHDRNVNRLQFYSDSATVKYFGFFTDLKQDTLKRSIEGICTYEVRGGSSMKLDSTFTYFDKGIMSGLFKDDEDGGKVKTNHKRLNFNYEKGDLLDDKLKIESFYVDKNNDLVLFCSRATNFISENCQTKTKCKSNFFCYKENVLALKTDPTGKLKWAKNIDRRVVYNQWDAVDLRTIEKDDKYYVIFGSDYAIDSQKKNYSSKKTKLESQNTVDYLVFDSKDGSYVKQELNVNNTNNQAKNKVSALTIGSVDGVFYIHSDFKKYKPVPAAIYGALGFFTLGVTLVPLLADPNNRSQANYTGSIEPK